MSVCLFVRPPQVPQAVQQRPAIGLGWQHSGEAKSCWGEPVGADASKGAS